MRHQHRRMNVRRTLFLVSLLVLANGCVGPIKSLYPPAPGEPTRTVYLITQGAIHTGIAVKRADIPEQLWPSKADYPHAQFLEIGWGDDDGYRKDLTAWIVIKAFFWPTRSVLQLDGFTNSVVGNFNDPSSTIIAMDLTERGFERLCEHISKTHALDEAGKPVALGNDWYRASGKYCVFKTCNTWVAAGLRKAGCPIVPTYCISRGPLVHQARKFGRVMKEPGQPPREER